MSQLSNNKKIFVNHFMDLSWEKYNMEEEMDGLMGICLEKSVKKRFPSQYMFPMAVVFSQQVVDSLQANGL